MKIISTDRAPAAIGPYSQGIVAGGFLFTSGQIPLDPATGALVAGSIEAQAERALANLRGVIEAAGGSIGQVAKVTLFLADMGDFAAVNGVYERFFGGHRPARTTVQVARLPKDARIEVEAIVEIG